MPDGADAHLEVGRPLPLEGVGMLGDVPPERMAVQLAAAQPRVQGRAADAEQAARRTFAVPGLHAGNHPAAEVCAVGHLEVSVEGSLLIRECILDETAWRRIPGGRAATGGGRSRGRNAGGSPGFARGIESVPFLMVFTINLNPVL